MASRNSEYIQSPGAVLLTGGTGKVASRIAPLLKAAGIPAIIASRRGTAPEAYTSVEFDWMALWTWEPALTAHQLVDAVFIVAPGITDPGPTAAAFIELARSKGARRFVLLSSSQLEEGGPAMGQIHKYLRKSGDNNELEWAVLRPSWFQENFETEEVHRKAIIEEGKVYSATGEGKIPWVSASDIAGVGFHALTTPQAPNMEYLVLGPELLTYGQVANVFTEVLGREITYRGLTEEELAQRHISFGLPKEYAPVLATLDTIIKNGGENRMNDVVQIAIGKTPRKFRDYVEEKKAVWL
ncbi:agroclavine dehydrogenase [Colletotrichum cereale]|nr:agroclavine dehydrogenase [Colletotrichum cereale]